LIVVDSSVSTNFLNGRDAPRVAALRATLGTDEIIVGDLMLCEVLQASQASAPHNGYGSKRFSGAMAGETIAVARNFRSLRKRGITVRKTIDLLIGTWCIENRKALLHEKLSCIMTSTFDRWPGVSG
jgi:predicted nucleic acid-binding protein